MNFRSIGVRSGSPDLLWARLTCSKTSYELGIGIDSRPRPHIAIAELTALLFGHIPLFRVDDELRQRLRWIAEREVGLRWRAIMSLAAALQTWQRFSGAELAKWLR
jgi:hypothetical protein